MQQSRTAIPMSQLESTGGSRLVNFRRSDWRASPKFRAESVDPSLQKRHLKLAKT